MGVRQWLVGFLSRGQVPEPDPRAMVEVETAPLFEAPMIIEALEREGINASSVEAFDPVTALSRARVMVRRSDVDAALGVIEGLRKD